MNEYYVTMGSNLAKIFVEDWKPTEYLKSIMGTNKFSFLFVSDAVILKALKSLPVIKSSGVLDLSTRLLSPRDWRPVSVLPMPSKIIERVVYKQLVDYFENNNLLLRNQHGFRKGLSTSTAIMDFVQVLYQEFDQRHTTSCIYVDYKRAFDTIDHVILCKKLALYGLDANSVNWCKNYLGHRKQIVKLNNVRSSPLTVTMGVPQGSIIGPFLFIVYINDLLAFMENSESKVTLYAEDTILYCSANSVNEAIIKNQRGCDLLERWCNNNRLSVNILLKQNICV